MGASLCRYLAPAAAAMALAGVLPAMPATAAEPPPYTLEERAEAIARPALVFLENKSTGYIRNKGTGELIAPDPITFYNRCSGFVVSADGYVLTTTNCVKPTPGSLRSNAVSQLANQLVSLKKLAPEQKATYINDLNAVAEFSGETPGSSQTSKVQAQPNSVRSGQATIAADVVAFQATDDGNVALVKLVLGGLPAVELGKTEIGIDTQLSLLAYKGVDLGEGQGMFAPERRVAKVNKVPTGGAGPSGLDSEIGPYSHGGMAVDRSGKVVGLINIDQEAKDQPRRALVTSSVLLRLLERSQVTNTLSRSDQAYRGGLDAFYGGRYSEAIGRFDEVLAVVPDHELAASYRKQATDRRTVEGDPKSDGLSLRSAVITGAVSALVVGALVFLILTVLQRRRNQRNRSAQEYLDMYAPVSAHPVSGGSVFSADHGTAEYPLAGTVDQLYRAEMFPASVEIPVPRPPEPAIEADDPEKERDPWAPPPATSS